MASTLSRRTLLKLMGAGTAGLALGRLNLAEAQAVGQLAQPVAPFTGPGPNPYWNSPGPLVSHPQKLPLIQLTDRTVQLETPRAYFQSAITPNEAFYVRWHLDEIPNSVDLSSWRLSVEGNVDSPLSLSLSDLLERFEPVSVAAVNQCSGNSRSFFEPRVPGGQWGNGAMGCAVWTGARLKDVLAQAGIKSGTVQLQFEGLDRGKGPEGKGSNAFLKSWNVDDPAIERGLIAYAMNGEPLPMLNGFPLRAVFPGKFATYWVKALSWIRALTEEDGNFWMNPAYRIPDTPGGNTTPEEIAAGGVSMVPIGTVDLPVRSFIASPDGSSKLPAGLPVTVRGIAFSGGSGVSRVELSADGGQSWQDATLGEDLGPYAFRTWSLEWTPAEAGSYTLAVRATDGDGTTQQDEAVWNPGGYLRNVIERQRVVVGPAA